ncbi:MAG: hypothetical protein CVV24_01695 [Ignavibacteriae bacterium HGW-Ignavibacteriae-3]|nr:MAG: hypothetical protein CVV24_01695 [Ignavibacteriae bacterium HGW-Ignavibacteriae-3]
MKKQILIIFLLSSAVFAQFKFGEAKGLFMAIGVGPRIPVGNMAENQNIGVGFDVTFSYTDNEYMPFFLYTSIGYGHFPGREDFYKLSEYSSFSSNVLHVAPGIRYYFKPILESVVLLMPIVDVGANWALFEKLHQFKIDSRKNNYVEEVTKFGFHVGVGFSMFILDAITYYNYYSSNQYLSFNLKANIPIFVKF